MRVRAVLLGFLGAIAICGLTYINDAILRQTYLVGNNLPVSVFGTLILFLILNVGLFALRERLALNGRELALILAMTLTACCIPGSGLMRTFPSSILMPHHHNKTNPSWQANRIIEEVVPETMLVEMYSTVVEGEITAADVATVTLDAAADATGEHAYEGMMIKVYDGNRRQARRIIEFDSAAKLARVDAKWDRPLQAGQRYRILQSNEEEVLTAYQQGQAGRHSRSMYAPVRGRTANISETSVVLGRGASSVDQMFKGTSIKLLSGVARGQRREITAYDGATRTATINKPFKDDPDPKTDYEIVADADDSLVAGLAAGGGAESITLSPTCASGNDTYADQQITITDGVGKGQTRTIIDYNGSSKTAVVDKPWDIPPAAGSAYEIPIDKDKLKLLTDALSGKVVSVPDAKSITLGPEATHRDNAYNGMDIQLGDGPLHKVALYKGKTRTLILDQALDNLPAAGTTYTIIPKPTVPTYAWSKTLSFWVPLILALWIAMVGLSVVLHRQWSTHEHLPYPVAAFADSLLPGENGRMSSIFRERMFWVAAAIILVLHLNNYIVTWFPDAWVQIPRQVVLEPLFMEVKAMAPVKGAWWMRKATVYFTVVAFAYFLSTDVSLSCGLAPTVYVAVVYYVGKFGVSMGGGGYFGVNHEKFLIFGAYLGLALILMYTGRTFYLSVARRALFLPARDKPPPSSIWGARVALLGYIVFIVLAALPRRLGGIGLDWQIAALYGAGVILLFTIMARIIAETGLFFIQSYWMPCGVIVGLFGARALGPQTMLVLFLLSMVLMVDPREALMPFMANNLKILELRRHKIGRTAVLCTAALVVGLAVAVPWTIYLHYRKGGPLHDGWATKSVPTMPFKEAIKHKQVLSARGQLEESMDVSGFERFFKIQPANGFFLLSLFVGCILVIGFSIGRLRFPNWPLHPVLFLIWAAYPAKQFAFSFLLGWLLKVLVTRFGGSRVYQKLKPMMFGLIAGELVGALIPIIFGFIYFLITKETPKRWGIFPG